MRNRINPMLKLMLLGLGATLTTALLLIFGQLLNAQLHADGEPAPAVHRENSHQDPLGKPGAAVQLTGPSVATMELHEQRELRLSLAVDAPHTLFVTVQPDEGLTLVSPQTRWEVPAATGEVELPVSIYAAARGNHFIHLFVTTEDQEGRQAVRTMAMQVRVGADPIMQMQVKRAAQPVVHPAFVSLPATETVH